MSTVSTSDGIQGSGAAVTPIRARPIELSLQRAANKLNIVCIPGAHAYAALFDSQCQQLAFGVAMFRLSQPVHERDQFRLDRKCETRHTNPSLWLGGAAFDLSPAEADQVEQAFAACGLVVERTEAA